MRNAEGESLLLDGHGGALGAGIYGLHGAVALRIADTVLGVTFGLVFAALFHRLAAVRLLRTQQAE